MTRPRQHNAIEVFTLPLGFTKLSRLSSFIQGELQPKCLLAPTRDFRSAIMDPVGFKKGHPTWELYVSAKMIFGYFIQVASKLKSGFKTTLCFICVAAESAESLLSQLLSKSFTARSGWERAEQINFWKVHCPALLCRDGWKTRTPLLWPTKLLLPSKRIKLFPFSVCRGKLSCSKMTGNDCDAGHRAQPQLLRTWHFLWLLHTDTPIRFCERCKVGSLCKYDSLLWESQNQTKLYRIAKSTGCKIPWWLC